ncbi:MAG: CDP-alcohol phosphatidyltransferase family protein [Beduini sp.]|uniref:CDP-alcohol phosphatidyltransferase family protein n=1 Tax=Beduini sp. TaxID=1922300 RepID=UPI0011C9FBCB
MTCQLPNLITLSRIGLSLLLLGLCDHHFLFLSFYGLCVLSDLLDGYLARKLKCTTLLGARLDSLADFLFLTTNIYLVVFQWKITFPFYIVIIITFCFVIRLFNFIYTYLKFYQWNMMHTYLNKITGFLLAFFIPIYLLSGTVIDGVMLLGSCFAVAASIEEALILKKQKLYLVNQKSIRE